MKILFFILTVAFFSPSVVRAEAVLDMSSSFQIARAKKIIMEGSAFHSDTSASLAGVKQSAKKAQHDLNQKTDRVCITGQYKTGQNTCASVQNGINCQSGYVKYSRKGGDEVYCVAQY